MDEQLLTMLKKIRVETMNKTLKKFSFSEIEEKTGVKKSDLLKFRKR
jgi:hypothetical protein